MQPDQVTRLGNSTIQHGPASDRVYLMKLDEGDMPGIVDDLINLGRSRGYSKLFVRVSARESSLFKARGFVPEARVAGMRKGCETGYFMSRYLDAGRERSRNAPLVSRVLDLAHSKAPEKILEVGDLRGLESLGPDNTEELAALYKNVFETYPFPIMQTDYLREIMASNVLFYGVRLGRKLIAAASAEIDTDWRCAEMTDFATLRECRGQGLAGKLLAYMERQVRARGIRTAYTIARAESPGMNIVFSSACYQFGGTLKNNTQIGGKLESMNVWYKQIISR
ncbi:GCN5-related N-acetyltransferase [Desulfovibrio ferrophilus]|uniref:GCN5-related N-acetyltransferase n=2 Tax=Desulfovibrio ferrophilus TaxID=241368 RepID=A0A2Z6AZG7_9BACT|nr:GCN5-related N-acetyltransferase [Desulfovibrio ferrophilus]